MDRNPIEQVFALPELVALIVLEWQLSNRTSGRDCLGLVARSWLAPVLAYEWCLVGSLSRLTRLPQTRQQYYANLIRTLDLDSLSSLEDLASGLTFPNLANFTYGAFRDSTDEPPLHVWAPLFLGPKLRGLWLRRFTKVTPELPYYFRKLCTNLEVLTIPMPFRSERHGNLLEDIDKSLPRLQVLNARDFRWSSPERFTLTLSALAKCEALEHLSFLRCDALELSRLHPQFTHLKSLQANLTYASLDFVAEVMPCLTELRIDVPPPLPSHFHHPVLAPLKSLRSLYKLELCLRQSIAFCDADFSTLSHFPLLSRLFVSCPLPMHTIDASDVTLDTFTAVFQKLPLLEELDLRLRYQIGATPPLVPIAKYCRKLTSLQLSGCCDLAALQSGVSSNQPAFPVLVYFTTDFLRHEPIRVDAGGPKAELANMVEVLRMLFPKVREFELNETMDLAARINTALALDGRRLPDSDDEDDPTYAGVNGGTD